MSPDKFHTVLAEQLIDNRYDVVGVGLRRRRDDYDEIQEPLEKAKWGMRPRNQD